MIQIDLGKDKLRQGGGGKGLLGKLGKFGGGAASGATLQMGGGLRKIGDLIGNVGGASLLLIAAAIATAPHLVFTRYQAFLEGQHQERMAELDAKIAAVNAEIGKMLPYQNELKSFEAQKKLVQERIAAIQALLQQRSAPVSFLDALGQSLPQRTWLQSLNFDLRDQKGRIDLRGQSLANEDIADYVDRLSESVHLRDVALEQVTANRASGAEGVETKVFEIALYPKSVSPGQSATQAGASPSVGGAAAVGTSGMPPSGIPPGVGAGAPR